MTEKVKINQKITKVGNSFYFRIPAQLIKSEIINKDNTYILEISK